MAVTALLAVQHGAFLLSNKIKEGVLCDLCLKVQGKLAGFFEENNGQVVDVLERICKIEGAYDICAYFVGMKGRSLLENKRMFFVKTNYLCANKFGFCPKKMLPFDFDRFYLDLFEKYPYSRGAAGPAKPFSALVLTDIHLQPEYQFKTNKNCAEQAGCCTSHSGFADKKADQAEFWGSPESACDLPRATFDATVAELAARHQDVDAIFLLGDNSGHDYFFKDEKYMPEVSRQVFESIRGNFTRARIVPTLGNHECHLVDFYDFDDKENFVAKNIFPLFRLFVGQKEVDDMISTGLFSQEFPEANIKVVSMNGQLGLSDNEYMIRNATNPLDFFGHLAAAFYEAEKKGQQVVLISHIPVTDFYLSESFTRCLNAVLERFNATLGGVLSGHTHNDHLKFIKARDGRVFGVNYISPSLTTSSSYRPSYRVYHFEQGAVVDYDQYNADIDLFNFFARRGQFDFKYELAYSFRKEYGLADWSPASYHVLADQLKTHSGPLVDKFVAHFFTQDVERHESHKFFVLCQLEDDYDLMLQCLNQYDDHHFLETLPIRLFKFLFETDWFLALPAKG